MKSRHLIVFRTDASIQIGSGHVMRCLTLAEELRNVGADVQFITRSHKGNLNSLIVAKGFALCELPATQQSESTVDSSSPYESWLGATQEQDAEGVIACLKGSMPDWLIVDHYALDETWEKLVRPYVKNIMVIDDLADRRHDCDLLLDQNYTRWDLNRYADLVPPSCTKLLGPRYALLRREFAEARRDLKPKDGTVKRLFVFFGGSDPDNMTGLAMRALSIPEFSHLEVDVVIGAANPHRKEIERLAESRPGTRLRVQVDTMAELMTNADLALCAGGSSTWERLCVGLPSLVVTIAENQVPFTRALHDDGFLRWIGPSQDVDETAIRKALRDALRDIALNGEALQRGFGLVDGVGGRRVAELITKGPDVASLTIRETEERDCALLWHWCNDPDVRNSAFNTDAVSWEDHQSWFAAKQRDSDSTIYIVESSFGPVGQVRFDRDGGHFRIDYSLARQYRGRGIGRPMLTLAINAFHAKEREGDMVAEVKSSNTQSGRIFERMGFEEITHTHTHTAGRSPLSITVLSDRNTWMNPWTELLLAEWAEQGHLVRWVHVPAEVPEGELCFMLSCSKLVKPEILARNRHNLVVHESDLPKGKGWSPMTWQLLEGKDEIPVALFEAAEAVDSGPIYLRDKMELDGHELVDGLRAKQADATMRLCRRFVNHYPDIVTQGADQVGEESFYPRRRMEDSRLDPSRSIAEQFDLLRVVDNDRYPAFFDWKGQRYIVKIEQEPRDSE